MIIMGNYRLYLSSLILAVSINAQICDSYKSKIEIIKIVRNKILGEIDAAKSRNDRYNPNKHYLDNLEEKLKDFESRYNNCRDKLSN